MKKPMVIGVDVGGSHISSAAVDLNEHKILPGTYFSSRLDHSAPKDDLMQCWSTTISQSIHAIAVDGPIQVGFAMPGPFQYHTGMAMFERNAKYENLYEVSIPHELSKYLAWAECEFRFLNDAVSFGVGVAALEKNVNEERIIALTLGTGFGSAFIHRGMPQLGIDANGQDPFLWDKPFREGIADEYFSTRWFIKRYAELTGEEVRDVKALAELNEPVSKAIFEEFGRNMADFMSSYLRSYQPQSIILGGNISKAGKLFLPALQTALGSYGLATKIHISDTMEEASIIGSAKLFDPFLWRQVKDALPHL
jgi:glucokinase